jgi:hypothetical protein
MAGRLGSRVLGVLARVHPGAWFAIGSVAIALLAHFGHIYGGDQRSQLGWGDAILAGLGLSSVAMFTWWVIAGRK